RAIGNPTFFGVESDRDIPSSILHRLVGEVNASHLRDVTLPTWDAFNTSSVEYQEFEESCRAWLRDRAIRLRDELLGSAPTEFVEQYRQQIERLPIPRRELARAALLRVFNRLFDEPMDKKHTVAELVL